MYKSLIFNVSKMLTHVSIVNVNVSTIDTFQTLIKKKRKCSLILMVDTPGFLGKMRFFLTILVKVSNFTLPVAVSQKWSISRQDELE